MISHDRILCYWVYIEGLKWDFLEDFFQNGYQSINSILDSGDWKRAPLV